MIRAIGVAVWVLIFVALATAVVDHWSLDPDAAAYVRLGRSIAESGTYALDGIPHGKYPPGLPLLVAALTDPAGQTSYAGMHLALVALLGLGVAATAGVVRRLGYGEAVVVAVALATALSQTFFELSVRYLRTEVPFFALSTGALWALLATLGPRDDTSPRGRLGAALAAASLTVASIATRLAGVTLGAVAAWGLVRRGASRGVRLRAVVLGLVAAATVAGWQARGRAIVAGNPAAVDYGAELTAAEPRDLTKVVRLDNPTLDAAALGERVVGNVEVFARACATLLTNVDRAAARLPVGLLFAALVAVGLVRMLTRRAGWSRQAVAIYTLATIALYLVWPFDQQERFYAPLLPWLLLAAGEGVAWLWSVARATSASRAGRWAIVAAAAAVWLVLALQRSDNPVWIGRYSTAYAGLLGVAALGVVGVGLVLKRGPLPALRVGAALLVPLLFALPWANLRFRQWPAQVAVDAAAVEPAGRYGPVYVHPVIRQMADLVVAHTQPDDVVMTDVPKMLAILTDRRCVPFTYAVDPPAVDAGDAAALYYTGELLEAIEVLDGVVARAADGEGDVTFTVLGELDAMPGPLRPDGTPRMVAPTLYRIERR